MRSCVRPRSHLAVMVLHAHLQAGSAWLFPCMDCSLPQTGDGWGATLRFPDATPPPPPRRPMRCTYPNHTATVAVEMTIVPKRPWGWETWPVHLMCCCCQSRGRQCESRTGKPEHVGKRPPEVQG